MNITNKNKYVIFSFIVLITGCSNQPSIQSVSDDMVVIKGNPDKFVEAHSMARNECQKNARPTEYNPDYSQDLSVVAFNCVEVVTEEASVEAEETTNEAEEVLAETEETPAESEEISAETEATTLETEETAPQ